MVFLHLPPTLDEKTTIFQTGRPFFLQAVATSALFTSVNSLALPEIALEKYESVIHPIFQAFIVRIEEAMGSPDQHFSADVTKILVEPDSEREVKIVNRIVAEDYSDTDALVLFFPAAPINGLTGNFVLMFRVENAEPSVQGFLTVRQVRLIINRSDVTVSLMIKGKGLVEARWAYARRPNIREVVVPMYDDPESFVEVNTLDYTVLAGESMRNFRAESEWKTYTIILSDFQIKQSVMIDWCYDLIEALNDDFSANNKQNFIWTQLSVNHKSIDTIASKLEERLTRDGHRLSFNITIDVAGKEIVRHERIRPLVKHHITIVDKEGKKHPATVGVSVSRL